MQQPLEANEVILAGLLDPPLHLPSRLLPVLQDHGERSRQRTRVGSTGLNSVIETPGLAELDRLGQQPRGDAAELAEGEQPLDDDDDGGQREQQQRIHDEPAGFDEVNDTGHPLSLL